MVIRPMAMEDIERVCEIEKDTFSLPWKASDFEAAIQDTNNIYLVAQVDDMLVAYCGLWGIVGEGHINNVAVAKEYRHQGIAYKMLSELIKEARLRGIETFTLEVRISNEGAINLYKKLGFKNAGIRPNFYIFPTEDALIMWL
ncbi:MAG: ribosomal protein S18-alanine N-acetyltransferase [Clostridiales bacterium]|jgi:ribosomal-protein-alanine N-acetyltransferase|nr:ribosomal protein S18-alanine N-acetyltransferase [Clostridiales bacterium]